MSITISPAMAAPDLIPTLKSWPRPDWPVMLQWWLWHVDAPASYVGGNRYPAITEVELSGAGIGYEAGQAGQESGDVAIERWRQVEPLFGFTPAFVTFDEPGTHIGNIVTAAHSVAKVANAVKKPIWLYEAYPRLSARDIHTELIWACRNTEYLTRFVLDVALQELPEHQWDRWDDDVNFLRDACQNLGLEFAVACVGQKERWDRPLRHTEESYLDSLAEYYQIVQWDTDHFTFEGGWEDSTTGLRDVPSTQGLIELVEEIL